MIIRKELRPIFDSEDGVLDEIRLASCFETLAGGAFLFLCALPFAGPISALMNFSLLLLRVFVL